VFPGIPELDVPSIEPLTLPEVLVAQGAGIKAVGKNIIINGPGSFIIKKLRYVTTAGNTVIECE
jgi:uncharacterized protein (DUF2345 family)